MIPHSHYDAFSAAISAANFVILSVRFASVHCAAVPQRDGLSKLCCQILKLIPFKKNRVFLYVFRSFLGILF